MAKTALVNPDIDRCREIVGLLERDHTVNVPLWAILPEYEDWRLVIAARQFDSLPDLGKAYGQMISTLNSLGLVPTRGRRH